MDSRLRLLGRSLDALPMQVAVLDAEGTIVQTNESWRSFGRNNGIRTAPETIGRNYIEVCEQAGTETAEGTARGLSALLDGTRRELTLEYPCHSPVEQRWFRLVAAPFSIGDEEYLVVAHVEVTDRALAERQLEVDHDRLSALNRLNTAVSDLTHVVIDRSTRAEIERQTCRVLADTDAYSCVWLGEVDARTDSVTVVATAGDCPGAVAVGDDVEAGTTRGYNVIRQAIWTRELQATTDMIENTAFDWTDDTADAVAYRSVAAVPVRYDGTLSHVCCLYTDRPDAFGPDERRVLDRTGEIVGHAIVADERRRALMGDERIEVELWVPNLFGGADRTGPSWSVRIVQTIAGSDDDYLMYGLASSEDLDAIEAAVDPLADVELVGVTDHGGTARLGFRLHRECLVALLADQGWSTTDAELVDGDCYLTAQHPSGGDVRRMVEVVTDAFPETELLARRQVESSPPSESALSIPAAADLTDRQRTILRTAHAAGYFEWPREASGEEIAETLGIASPTFHQHLRVGQKKLMDAILAGETVAA
ncbi:MAG: bacterio-opsin activator domain-containing protein [Halohasta sp.]